MIIEKLSGRRIKPANKEEKDPWTYKIPGGLLPPRAVRAARGKKDSWREDEESIGVDADRASEFSPMDRMTEGRASVRVQPGEKATV
jgi:AGZA family xanthine/uracil permease-like MFS transporter